MAWLRWVLGLVGVAVVGGLVYGWGIGIFHPCGPVDKLLHFSKCTVVQTFDATQVDAMTLLPNGNLLVVTRGDAPQPTQPHRLVEISPADAKVISSVDLIDVPPEASVMSIAASPDGKSIAAAIYQEKTAVIDRANGQITAEVDLHTVSHVGFSGNDRLLVDLGLGSFERPATGSAQVFDAVTGAAMGEASGATVWPMFATGLSQAISADGTLLAQHLESRGDSGVVAIRLADAKFADWSGRLLVAPLDTGVTQQILPEMSFSPDGKYLAAAFDNSNRWGVDTAALIVWDVASGELVARLPTYNTDWRSLTWLPEIGAIAATRFDLGSRVGEVDIITLGQPGS